jgi:hypothetical protein
MFFIFNLIISLKGPISMSASRGFGIGAKLSAFHWLSPFDLTILISFLCIYVFMKGGLVKAGLDVAQIWLDGDGTLVNTVDRDGNMLPINMVRSHALTHDPLVVLVSFLLVRCTKFKVSNWICCR